MSDDWGWYFTSAERRTSILRDQLDAANAAAAAQSSRLSSQLRTLQGSIETRLKALSAAFDAYVELGDIREQLAGFPDTTVVRRDVALAIDALAQGRRAERVDDRGETYWLPHAANAVIGLVEGRPDAAAEQNAHDLSPQAELFVVAACGALHHGTAVADRLPPLLTCDDRLNDDQLALWGAAVAGEYGPVLPAIRPVWARAIEQANADVGGWRAWCQAQSRSRDAEAIVGWIADLLGVGTRSVGSPASPAAPEAGRAGVSPAGTDTSGQAPEPADVPLRAVVTRLVAQGTDQEAPLLERARELRERIENPGRTPAGDRAEENSGSAVIDVVREALLATEPGSPERIELLSWVGRGLRAAAEAEAATLATLEPISERIHTADGEIDVTSSGPEPGQVERVKSRLIARNPTSPVPSGIAAGVTGVFLILSIVLFVLGSGWAFLTALITVAAAVATIRAERSRRGRKLSAATTSARIDADIDDARGVVAARIDARERTRTEVTATLEKIRAAVPSEPA